MEKVKNNFLTRGYASLERLIPKETVDELKTIYDTVLNDKENTLGLRSDLAGGVTMTIKR